MIDASTLRSKLHAAIESFVDRAVASYVEENKRRASAQTATKARRSPPPPTPAAPARAPKVVPAPKPQAKPAAKAAPKVTPPSRSLRDRPNVIAFLAGKSPPPPPSTLVWSKSEIPVPKGPPPAEIMDRAVAAVLSATEPLTFDQLRARVRVSKEALLPLIDQMVAARKIAPVEVEVLTRYKRPRIEPIRRQKGPTP